MSRIVDGAALAEATADVVPEKLLTVLTVTPEMACPPTVPACVVLMSTELGMFDSYSAV